MPPRRGRTSIAKHFIADAHDKALHAMAFRFLRLFQTGELTERQDWFWQQILDELARRRAAVRPIWMRCSCQMCWSPFEEPWTPEEPF